MAWRAAGLARDWPARARRPTAGSMAGRGLHGRPRAPRPAAGRARHRPGADRRCRTKGLGASEPKGSAILAVGICAWGAFRHQLLHGALSHQAKASSLPNPNGMNVASMSLSRHECGIHVVGWHEIRGKRGARCACDNWDRGDRAKDQPGPDGAVRGTGPAGREAAAGAGGAGRESRRRQAGAAAARGGRRAEVAAGRGGQVRGTAARRAGIRRGRRRRGGRPLCRCSPR